MLGLNRTLLICSIFLAMAAVSFAQERYAVLVGVGQYPHLSDSLQLAGPSNDVRLVRNYLLNVEGFNEDDIAWLSDEAPTPPQRANILAALTNVDKKVQKGDFVLLHFSGHGSRQPAKSKATEELDGYDEIFLPQDVKGWNKAIGSVENAILDDAIGLFIRSYRRKGADVWVIFDSCHSGTMTRGRVGHDSVRTRQVSGTVLGIPDRPADRVLVPNRRPKASPFADESSGAERGMLIAFLAAHASEEAPELLLPKRSDRAEPHGLLSYSINTVLARHPRVSYRQLAQLVTDQYASLPWLRSRPQFYGTDTDMDRTVFNGSGKHPSLFLATMDKDDRTRLTIAAGALRGFDMGAGVAIYANASDTDENLLGTGTVDTAEATQAVVKVVWHPDTKMSVSPRMPVYVRLVQPAYESRVLIALLDTSQDKDNQRLREIVASLEPHVPLVKFSDGYDPSADYFAAFFDEKFWLLRPGQILPCSVQDLTEIDRVECERAHQPEQLFWSVAMEAEHLISRAARARSLTKLQGVVNLPSSLSVDVWVQRSNSVQDVSVSLDDYVGSLHAGDQIYYSVRNEGSTAWDIFLFYVDSQLGIQALQDRGHSARLLPDETIDTKLLGEINNKTLGAESLVVIAEPARDGVEADYNFLAQGRWSRVRTRGTRVLSPLRAILEGLSVDPEGAHSRGVEAAIQSNGLQGQVKIFTWTVEEAL